MAAQNDLNVFQEYADSSGQVLRVDREKGIIAGVKLLGTTSKKNREYPREVIAKAVPLYEGQVVNIDHVEAGQRRSLRDRVGVVKNVVLKEDGLYGDFHFNPKHALAEQIAWDAENAPQKLGFSHDTRSSWRNRNGKVVVESIDRVVSVDLVANPATTTGLFESNDPLTNEEENMSLDLSKLTVQELRESRDDLVKTILTEANEGQKITALESQIKTLQESLDGYKAAEAKRTLQESIVGELKAAGLDPANKVHVSDVFLEDLAATEDTARRAAKIADRKAVVGASPATKTPAGSAVPVTMSPLQESTDGLPIPPASAPLSQRLARFAK